MISTTTSAGAPAADPAVALAAVFAIAAGFFAVALHYYLRVTGVAERLLIARTKKRLRRSARFLQMPRLGRTFWAVDVVCVLGVRAAFVIYVGFLWFVAVPALMTLGSIALATSLIPLH